MPPRPNSTRVRWLFRNCFSSSSFASSQQQWSLQTLAGLKPIPETAKLLLHDVSERLTHQQSRIEQDIIRRLLPSTTTVGRQQKKHVDHLIHLHQDTTRLCQQLLSSQVMERWNTADQSVVASTFQQVRDRHATSIERYMDLVLLCDDEQTRLEKNTLEPAIQSILQARWGILLLCDHYVKLSSDRCRSFPHGAVSIDCPVVPAVVQEAVTEAKHICEAHWLTAPDVVLLETRPNTMTATIIRPWLHHAFVELLKNAMHATLSVATNRNTIDGPPPPRIELEASYQHIDIIDSGKMTKRSFLQVDIRDQGIGLPNFHNRDDDDDSDGGEMFRLGQSSLAVRWDRLKEQQSYAAVRSPMNSLGVGLPTSRMMMRHFGGNVQLLPGSSGGCTARIHVPLDVTLREPIVPHP
jgi:pyruvate dehydrogenase kinase 2/3/4